MINRNLALILALCIYIFSSCDEGNKIDDHKADVIELDIRKVLNQKEDVHFLSDLAVQIQYIPLETNESCLLTMIHDIFLYRDHIFISDFKGLYHNKGNNILAKTDKLINDIDGGMPFWPKMAAGNTLIAHYQAYEIIDYYRSTIETIDHGESFVHLVNNLDDGDNPVLILLQ